jgi:hypothetical protein
MDFDTSACLLDDDGYPWHDEEYCIWLDPTDDQTMAYLIQICTELQSLGFDEVVFYEFRFPDSSNYNFDSDLTQKEAINQAAADLISACTTGNFAVSFESDSSFTLPEGRTGGVRPRVLPSVSEISTWASFLSGPSTATL